MNTSTTPLVAPTGAAPLLVLAYGVTGYTIGVAGLVWLIAVTLGLVPFTGGPVALDSTAARVALNVGLIALFGLQHAVMARPAFKERWTRIVPPAAERATFTLLSGGLMGLAMWLWQPLGGTLWNAETPALRWGLLGLCAFGWVYLLASTFAIDHFELFGLRQVWRHARGLRPDSPSFKERLMYRFDRHPIMTGVLLGLWAMPDLTMDRLLLAGAFTAYMVIGVTLEERDLAAKHGEAYLGYARRVRTIVPRLARLG